MTSATPYALQRLAQRIVDLQASEVPISAFKAARRCLIDAIGCASAGRREYAVSRAIAWAQQMHRGNEASVWFEAQRLTVYGAAFVNAVATSILDLDDGNRTAAGHPGAAIVPAVLAVGQVEGATLEQMLLAIIAGYEAGVGTANARTRMAQAHVATGRWSTIGVAAAIAKLRGYDTDRMRHALTIAEAHAPNLLAADHAGFMGGHIKEGIPWSVLTGLSAAELARFGWLGYDRALDNPAMYRADSDPAIDDVLLIERTYFKRYACCRWTHSAIDAALSLQANLPAGAEIPSLSIATFTRSATLPNLARPAEVIDAQFSLPFVVAAALLRGPDCLLPMDPGLLEDVEVHSLAQRIYISVDPELDAMYPTKVPARVSMGGQEAQVISPLGDWDHPMRNADLVSKALRLSALDGAPLLSSSMLNALLDDQQDAQLLWRMLQAKESGRA